MDNNSETVARSHGAPVRAGLPGPVRDPGQDRPLMPDLNRLLVRHPGDTCLLRISGHTWADQGVYDGDIAVIDRAAEPRTTDLVVGGQARAFSLYRFTHHAERERPWGIVVAVIHPTARLSLGRLDRP